MPVSVLPPAGYFFFGQQVSISMPPATAAKPIVIVFRIGLQLFHEAIARRAAVLSAFFPSMIVWSSMALKDTAAFPAPVLHVTAVQTTSSTGTPQTTFAAAATVYWRVRVADQAGHVFAGASVTTSVKKSTGAVWATATATSGTDGWATFSKKSARQDAGSYTVTVSGVTATGATYDPSANTADSASFTIQ